MRRRYEVPSEFWDGNYRSVPDGAELITSRLSSGRGSAWTWLTLQKVVAESPLPVIVKGVLSADDAERAAEAGASAIVISNHGGRQLDGAPSTLSQLPIIVARTGSGGCCGRR